ncbi:type II-A CRISPR-associated protein Csn2 [Fructilactobacillus vespulae]|uniref:type II-A CRISPR-associated protein Csn2 n=1 Tax=Fructilactobacillus vespulae TaxID=1249630 RepID=UPI0039B684DE
MKLTLYPIEPFEINAGKLTIIKTENKNFYFNLISGLVKKEGIKLSDENKLLSLKTNLIYLGDIYTKTNLLDDFKKNLENEITSNLSDENRKRLFMLDNQMKEIFMSTIDLDYISLESKTEWDIKKQYKLSDIIISESETDPYGILKQVLDLYTKFNNKKLIVLNDVFNYLYPEQIQQIIQQIKSLGLYVLILDFSNYQRDNNVEECRVYRIDRDFVRWSSNE